MSWGKLDEKGGSWADVWKPRVWEHCESCLMNIKCNTSIQEKGKIFLICKSAILILTVYKKNTYLRVVHDYKNWIKKYLIVDSLKASHNAPCSGPIYRYFN